MIVAKKKAAERIVTVACLATDDVGCLVAAASIGVERANVSSFPKMPAVGIIIAKPSSLVAQVQIAGVVRYVLSGLTPGRIYFVGEDGIPVTTPPTPPPGQVIYMQAIGTALAVDQLLLTPTYLMAEVRG